MSNLPSNEVRPINPDIASVRISPIEEQSALGLCVEAIATRTLASWAPIHRAWIELALLQQGALLFRGFDVRSVGDFEQFIAGTSDKWTHYREAATPRSPVTLNIATSTEYPSRERILLHNENSHCTTWPSKIYFWCEQPAESGGETPIADCRRMYTRIDDVIRNKFVQHGILYVRNFTPGLGIPWQKSLNCQSQSDVECYAREQDMKAEWLGEDHLRLQYVRPATVRHRLTAEPIWFNHGTFFNLWALKPTLREALLEATSQTGVPYDTFFGNGEPLTQELVEYLMRCYECETLTWRWRQGDVLLLDNMLVAHGRMPFVGKRRVLTGMADPVHYRNSASALSASEPLAKKLCSAATL
jgi:alpha-ketoglutarate-dependent taurine dioxygenase